MPNLRTILLIQNDPEGAAVVREALTTTTDGFFEIEWVKTFTAGVESLLAKSKQDQAGLSAVLIDIRSPDCIAIEAFDGIFRSIPDVPILILCGQEDESLAKLAVKHGAQDYILKSRIDSYALPQIIRSMVERKTHADALFAANERARVTLESIGDAVITTDDARAVTYLNAVAEDLTGWSRSQARGHLLEDVFHIVDATTRMPMVNPMDQAIHENRTIILGPNAVLLRRDGTEVAIEDSTSPIHDRSGRVTGAVLVFHDAGVSRDLTARMTYMAKHDHLTDLPNRTLFTERVTQSIALAHRNGQQMSVLFLDLDRFKHINDSVGHSIGDRLLKCVAERVLKCLRRSDSACRYGGDEFAILLAEVTHAADAALVADKILLSLNAPYHIDHHELHISATIGIATYPADGTEAESLAKNADFAMYAAKKDGGGKHRFFKADMNVRAVERQCLETKLRHILQRRELELHYQPQLDFRTGEIVGAEALIRWRDPVLGFVSPADFLPVAEECGFIVPIGRWVLRQACEQALVWQNAGHAPIRIAVNMSAAELRAKDCIKAVEEVLDATGLNPNYLEIELTETFLMQHLDSTASVLQALKSMGVRLALDDFGTGYSSLTFLKRFPIDTLKIDQSFVRDITTDSDDASIVSAVIGMGADLNMLVIAEGVETREQLNFLQLRGCREGEGYYFSRAVVGDKFAELLSHGCGGLMDHMPMSTVLR